MSNQTLVLRVLCAAIASAAACSGQSPVAPATSASALSTTADGSTASKGKGGPGTGETIGIYEIVFLKEAGLRSEPVVDNTLNVGEFLVLMARVTDASGVPAQDGRITYEYCSLNNVKVPSAECESGPGRWRRLWSMDVDPVGSRYGFGTCSTPRTIGFRLRYDGAGDIADGVSAPKDVTWQ